MDHGSRMRRRKGGMFRFRCNLCNRRCGGSSGFERFCRVCREEEAELFRFVNWMSG
jgi:hypothetical protein